jgi:acid phosphatase family membrane protein YuiD
VQVFSDIFNTYKALIVPSLAWLLAQTIKLIITLITEKRFDLSQMTTMGGMPSSHSSTVCALATTIGKLAGWDSYLFAITVFLAVIVMYDAGGVRRTVGNQSVVLNKILDELFKGQEAFEERLKEFIGHTRFEIFVGGALGIGLAWWLA